MATVNYVIFGHHLKNDGTYNVKYRITHRGKQVYYSSSVFVAKNQLKKDLTIKDTKILDQVNAEVAILRSRVTKIGMNIDSMTAKEVMNTITEASAPVKIDFIVFFKELLSEIKSKGNIGSWQPMSSALRSIERYAPSIDVNDLDSEFLKGFESYLRQDKTIVSNKKSIKSSLGDNGINILMSKIRSVHNACKKKYNTEKRTIVTSDPFRYYDIPKYVRGRKDMNKYDVGKIIYYRDAGLRGVKKIARDIFMLSFYLCGMNAKDMYDGNYVIKDGRIEYERSKTRGRRSDRAFISIKIPDVAVPLLEQYTGKYLQRRYNTHDGFKTALSTGCKGTGFTFYDARHAFASLAANVCGFGLDAVEAALNHFDKSRLVNTYVARDWSVIDQVQAGVLQLLFPGEDKIK